MINAGEVNGSRVIVCGPVWVVLRKWEHRDEWMPFISTVAGTRIEAVHLFNRMSYPEKDFGFEDDRAYTYTPLRRHGLAIAVKVWPNFNV